MKFLAQLVKISEKLHKNRLDSIDHKQQLLVNQGREQFKKLLEKGLRVPVVLL